MKHFNTFQEVIEELEEDGKDIDPFEMLEWLDKNDYLTIRLSVAERIMKALIRDDFDEAEDIISKYDTDLEIDEEFIWNTMDPFVLDDSAYDRMYKAFSRKIKDSEEIKFKLDDVVKPERGSEDKYSVRRLIQLDFNDFPKKILSDDKFLQSILNLAYKEGYNFDIEGNEVTIRSGYDLNDVLEAMADVFSIDPDEIIEADKNDKDIKYISKVMHNYW